MGARVVTKPATRNSRNSSDPESRNRDVLAPFLLNKPASLERGSGQQLFGITTKPRARAMARKRGATECET